MTRGIREMTGHLALPEHKRKAEMWRYFLGEAMDTPVTENVYFCLQMIMCVHRFPKIHPSASSCSNSGTCIYYMILFLPEFIREISLVSAPICSIPHSSLTFYSFPSILQLSGSLSPRIVSSHIDLSPSIVS